MPISNRIVAILDVGHGNSTIIKDEAGIVIIDAGTKSTLLEFLLEQGIEHIDTILISHADQDHIGGIVAILSSGKFGIGKIRLNTDSLKGTDAWDDLLYELDRMGVESGLDFRPSLTINDIDEYNLTGYKIQILGPSNYLAAKGPGSRDRQGRKITTNSISAVIRILDDKDIPILLLPGDIDEIGLDDLIEHKPDASTPILIFPHHGGLPGSRENIEGFTLRLSTLINPNTVIFSIERSDRYSTPRPEIITTLFNYSKDIRIMCTELSGFCANRLPMASPTHLSGLSAQGYEDKKCCAGSIIIDSSLPDPIIPLLESHNKFINSTAPTALCRLIR
jgi:competence protein ComEC